MFGMPKISQSYKNVFIGLGHIELIALQRKYFKVFSIPHLFFPLILSSDLAYIQRLNNWIVCLLIQ